jgi:hypothetical protein
MAVLSAHSPCTRRQNALNVPKQSRCLAPSVSANLPQALVASIERTLLTTQCRSRAPAPHQYTRTPPTPSSVTLWPLNGATRPPPTRAQA